MRIRFYLLLALTVFVVVNSSAVNIDSLKLIVQKKTADTNRVNALNELSRVNVRSDIVTAESYADEAISLAQKLKYETGLSNAYNIKGLICRFKGEFSDAITWMKKSLTIRERLKDTTSIGGALVNIGGVYYYMGEFKTAIEYYKKATLLLEKGDNKDFLANVYNNIGLTFKETGNMPDAIEYLLKALRIREDLKDTLNMANVLNNLGIVYNDLKDTEKAKDYYQKSYDICNKAGDKHGMALSLSNMANILHAERDYNVAIEKYKEALELQTQIMFKNGMGITSNNIANMYRELKDYDLALEYYIKALKIQEGIGDKKGITVSTYNAGITYFILGQNTKALQCIEKALAISQEIGLMEYTQNCYQKLSLVHKKLNNPSKALDYYILYTEIKDSIYSEETNKMFAEAQTKYETEKKENEILLLNKDKKLQEAEIIRNKEKIAKQRIQVIAVSAGFALILIFSVIVLRLLAQKRKANKLLFRQNEEIKQKNEEIQSQRDEIIAQRDQVTLQRDRIEEQKKSIEDSIVYAQRIQKAVIPSEQYLNSVLGEHYVIYKPKDVVSGDFYFATKLGNKIIVAVADCTGHGVPGAFMSMLGMSFLNEIVRKKEITAPAEILNLLRVSIIDALKQSLDFDTQKDGMDIALCTINLDTLELHFAGANNPLYIVTGGLSLVTGDANQQPETSNQQLIELKGDKMPIGIHTRMDPFTNQKFQLNKGDIIHLFSDGMPDQFGGAKGRKYMHKTLKQLTCDLYSIPIKEQGNEIENEFEKWIHFQGQHHHQIDDVTLLGIKV